MTLRQSLLSITLAAGTALLASCTVVSFAETESASKPASEFDAYTPAPKKASRFTDGVERIRATGRSIAPLVAFYKEAFPEIKAARPKQRALPKGDARLTVTLGLKLRRLNDPALMLLVRTLAERRVDPPTTDASTFVFDQLPSGYARMLASQFEALGETARVDTAPACNLHSPSSRG
jgi:hypothetical protein